jgi:hypothetical protein
MSEAAFESAASKLNADSVIRRVGDIKNEFTKSVDEQARCYLKSGAEIG